MLKVFSALLILAIMTATTALAIITETSETTTWTGNAQNQNWHDPNNWSHGVPNAHTDAIIPGGQASYPVIGADAAVNNLTLEDGAYLIDNGNLSINGTFTMKRGDLTIPHDWRMISAPVTGKTIVGSDFVPTTDNWGEAGNRTFDFYAFNETIPRADGSNMPPWINIRLAGETVNPSFETEFQKGKGYLVAYNDSYPGTTFHFNGTMNTGDVTVPLTYSENAHPDDRGWNLVGNPYPSGYLWDGAAYDDLESDFAYIYFPEHMQFGHYSFIESGTIPPNQGFFVRAAEGGGSLTFLDANRVNAGIFFKKHGLADEGQHEPEESIVLAFGAGERTDRATIRIVEGSSFDSDRRDAFKLFSLSQSMPQIYTIADDNERLAVNSIPDVTEEVRIPAGLRVTETGSYFITAIEITGRFATMNVFLFDQETGTEVRLSEDCRYDFVANESDNDHDNPRFEIRFQMTGEPTRTHPFAKPTARIYCHENILSVVFSHTDSPQRLLEVYDLYGRLLVRHQLEHGTTIRKHLNLAPGIYLVRVEDHNGSLTERIIVK